MRFSDRLHRSVGRPGDGGPALAAALIYPVGIALDSAGNLYIADTGDNRIRKVTPNGTISTVAGDGRQGFGGDGGPATSAQLDSPQGVAVDGAGNVYIADSGNHRVRRISAGGAITTVAGIGKASYSGDGGLAIDAAVNFPKAVAVDSAGVLYIGDTGNNRLRSVDSAGVIRTLAGGDRLGSSGDGGPAAQALLSDVSGVAIDRLGNIYIGDFANARVRRIDRDGTISTVAGNGLARFFGDNGPARNASFDSPQGVSVYDDGAIYIADSVNHRIRRIAADGVITTVAGNGQPGFSGDDGSALKASLNHPQGSVARDRAGNLYFADRINNRVRRVSSAGVITTVAGTGEAAYSGDGGPAAKAALNFPSDVEVDAAGNLYIGDRNNHRIRKVTPAGVITTVAGNGMGAFSGDGGRAVDAGLQWPYGVTLDSIGNLYIADYGNRRLRRVSPEGIISTIAGNGDYGFNGDGKALLTSIDAPLDMVVDGLGNLLFVDYFNGRIRRWSPDGAITTLAGNGQRAFNGDGLPALNAAFNLPTSISLDAAGNLLVADSGNGRIRAVLASSPSLTVSRESVSLSAASNGPPSRNESLRVTSGSLGVSFSIGLGTNEGGAWLRASPIAGGAPSSVDLWADPTGLNPGTYTGAVTVRAPYAVPPTRVVAVTLKVEKPDPPRLGLQVPNVDFSFAQAAAPATANLSLSNLGSGSINFSAAVSTASGGDWLSIFPQTGTVSAVAPASLTLTVTPGQLAAGTYTGSLTVTSASTSEVRTVPVAMAISSVSQKILLSQTGLTFAAVAKGGKPLAQRVAVLNLGQGLMPWSAEAVTLAGGSWLQVSPSGGASPALPGETPFVDVAVEAADLKPGDYFGFVRVAAPSGGSPQIVSVFLNVLPPDSAPAPEVQPSGLVFTGVRGSSPGSQSVLVSNVAAAGLAYQSSRVTNDQTDWFVHAPTNAVVRPGQPARIVVQPDFRHLSAGVKRGVLTLLFGDGTIRTVTVMSVVGDSENAAESKPGPERAAGSSCSPSSLLPGFTSLSNGFVVPASQPLNLTMRVVDNCGAAVTSGAAVVRFSNGDPDLMLAHVRNGEWTGTWQPRNTAQPQVRLVSTAVSVQGAARLLGGTELSGFIRAGSNGPILADNAVVNAASYLAQAPVAPGSLVSLFGARLADSRAAGTRFPLGTNLAGTEVMLGGKKLPLLYVSDGQVNAQVPYDLDTDMPHQLVVQRGTTISVPGSVTVASAQPAIFTLNQSGAGQGIIFHASPAALADASNPARAGETVNIYCSGLGAVNPPIEPGVAATSALPAVNPVTVTIGGRTATVSFAGLAPGQPGLYRVDAAVPSGITAGNAVPVVIAVAGQTSPAVTMAVR